jgi:hypothetical protein
VTERRAEILRARVRVLQRKQKRIPHSERARVGVFRNESRQGFKQLSGRQYERPDCG